MIITYADWIKCARWAYIIAALKETNGNISQAAKLIKMGRNTLMHHLHQWHKEQKNGN